MKTKRPPSTKSVIQQKEIREKLLSSYRLSCENLDDLSKIHAFFQEKNQQLQKNIPPK
jgi:hypothetical protein